MKTNLEKALGFELKAFNYLYVLCDYETLLKKDVTLEKFVNLCKKHDVKIVQYRDKISPKEEQKTNLLYLKSQLNIPIIINDKIELIEFADGLHLGQEDFSKIHKDKRIAIKLIRLKIKDKPTTDRLENSGPFGTMCTHRVKLSEAKEVDKELTDSLKEAYEKAG